MVFEIDKINKFIDENLKNEFSLSDISSYAGYSAYHFSREFKRITGKSVMDYVRERKLLAAAKDIKKGKTVLETAIAFGFDTHSGFTRAFSQLVGCTPRKYQQHGLKYKQKEGIIMDNTKIKVRLVCEDDLNDLWENVYSAMTPRQITENKILPGIENYKNKTGFLAVAELDGVVVMSMWIQRLYSGPGFIYDSHYIWQNDEYDNVFVKLIDGVKVFAHQLNMNALCLYENEDSDFITGFEKCNFIKVFNAGGLDYYMLKI